MVKSALHAISPAEFISFLSENKINYFVGVPDSLLKNFGVELSASKKSTNFHHLICADEGQAVAIAAGWHLATQSYGCVYMQNSGLGNAINPLLSIVDPLVYSIPMLIVIGWRGKPGVADEPQHAKQGEVTLSLLEAMGIPFVVLNTQNWREQVSELIGLMAKRSCAVALVVEKDSFAKSSVSYSNDFVSNTLMMREEALSILLGNLGNNDLVISTTGKTSREIFELREAMHENHEQDFLNIGGMGHTSSLAFGISEGTNRCVWCIDGDGALLMHLGSLAVIAQNMKGNYRYVVNINGVHESVGGQPNVAANIDVVLLLKSLGFGHVFDVQSKSELICALGQMSSCENSALVIHTKPGSRETLGRPTNTPLKMKKMFMTHIAKL